MRASLTPLARDAVTLIGEGLDHPECVCVGDGGVLFAGGEAGQIYRIELGGPQRQIAATGGFLLGIALDGRGRLYACDCGQRKVWRIDPDGAVAMYSDGAPSRPFTVPNFPVFDSRGNLFVSDSGDYWNAQGNGCVMRINARGETSVFHAGPFRFANGLAIDPTETWLYVAQTTAANIVRVPLNEPNGRIEVTHELPAGTAPDGLAFAADGQLVIACYKPDGLFLGAPDGHVTILCDDPTGELLSRPTNVALTDGRLYVANLGGWHLTSFEVPLAPRPLFRPLLDY